MYPSACWDSGALFAREQALACQRLKWGQILGFACHRLIETSLPLLLLLLLCLEKCVEEKQRQRRKNETVPLQFPLLLSFFLKEHVLVFVRRSKLSSLLFHFSALDLGQNPLKKSSSLVFSRSNIPHTSFLVAQYRTEKTEKQ